MHADSLAPIFLTSSVTGQGLDLIRLFYSLLPQRHNWFEHTNEAAQFIIDETFGVPGVGTVVAGTVKRGVIAPNSTLLLGPDIGDGSFKPVTVKSVHYKRLPVGRVRVPLQPSPYTCTTPGRQALLPAPSTSGHSPRIPMHPPRLQVVAGQTAALALKKVKRGQVRKGMVLVDEKVRPKASWEFDAGERCSTSRQPPLPWPPGLRRLGLAVRWFGSLQAPAMPCPRALQLSLPAEEALGPPALLHYFLRRHCHPDALHHHPAALPGGDPLRDCAAGRPRGGHGQGAPAQWRPRVRALPLPPAPRVPHTGHPLRVQAR
jgi:hypothetical protein